MARPRRATITPAEIVFAELYRSGGVSLGVAYARANNRDVVTGSDHDMGRRWWQRDTVKEYIRQCAEKENQPVERPSQNEIASPRRERAKRVAMEVENEKARQDGEIDFASWGTRSDLLNNLKRLAINAFTDATQFAATIAILKYTGQDWIEKVAVDTPLSGFATEEFRARLAQSNWSDNARNRNADGTWK